MTRLVLACTAALLLTACDRFAPAETPADDTRRAEGEVSGGTISDAMLPLDAATSTPPAAKPTATGTASGAKTTGAKDSGDEAEAVAAPAAEPSASPSPAASAD